MNKFNLKDNDVQGLEFNNKKLIKDFFDYNFNFWKQDICKFDKYMEGVIADQIEKVYIWTWNITDKSEDFKADLYLNDGTKRDLFYCNYETIMTWLKKNNLIE